MLLTLHVRLCATVAGAWPSARSNTAWHRFQDRVRFAALAAASSSARCVSVRITSIIGISSRDPRAYPFHLSSSTHLGPMEKPMEFSGEQHEGDVRPAHDAWRTRRPRADYGPRAC